jgi:hypothetical protein
MSDITCKIHVGHFFPKGYDPLAEPYRSIINACNNYERLAEQCDYLTQQNTELREERDYADGWQWAEKLADVTELLMISCSDKESWAEANSTLGWYYAAKRHAETP